jgi:hypothetical protein
LAEKISALAAKNKTNEKNFKRIKKGTKVVESSSYGIYQPGRSSAVFEFRGIK